MMISKNIEKRLIQDSDHKFQEIITKVSAGDYDIYNLQPFSNRRGIDDIYYLIT